MDRTTTPQRAFFGRRKGHPLRPRQAALFDTLLPRIALDLDQAGARRSARAVRTARPTTVRLEIGFGGAEHLIAQAQAQSAQRLHRQRRLSSTPSAKALAAIEDNELGNIRLHFGDASELLDWLPDGALARIDLLYPDPWPKRRHWKRRFIQDDSLKRLARILKSRRRIALCHRHRRLRGLCAGARAALAGFRLDRGARRRLAASLAGFFRHALRSQGQARRPHAGYLFSGYRFRKA